MDLIKAMKLSTAGMRVQGTRLRVISENIANADSLPDRPGDMPYRRKHITFKNILIAISTPSASRSTRSSTTRPISG